MILWLLFFIVIVLFFKWWKFVEININFNFLIKIVGVFENKKCNIVIRFNYWNKL